MCTAVTGVSGSGKSTLIGEFSEDLAGVGRLWSIDHKPIGRTPRSNLATCTGLFDVVRRVFAPTDGGARPRLWRRAVLPQRGGRALRDLPGQGLRERGTVVPAERVRALPAARWLPLQPRDAGGDLPGRAIAQVLDLTAEAAAEFFADIPAAARSLGTLHDAGLGCLRLGRPATELSGGEAQRVKLAGELRRRRRMPRRRRPRWRERRGARAEGSTSGGERDRPDRTWRGGSRRQVERESQVVRQASPACPGTGVVSR